MPLLSSDARGRYWERTALPVITTLVPGAYINPSLTIDEYGRVVSIIAGGTGVAGINARDSGVPVVGGPFSTLDFIGSNITAVDGGSGKLNISVSALTGLTMYDEGVTVPNGPFTGINFVGAGVTATDGGGGLLDVSVNTNTANSIYFTKSAVGIAAVQNIGSPIDASGIITEVRCTILTPYSAGATLQIQDGVGTVLMNSLLIDPSIAGTYALELPRSITATIHPQMILVVGGAPVAGTGIIDVYYEVA